MSISLSAMADILRPGVTYATGGGTPEWRAEFKAKLDEAKRLEAEAAAKEIAYYNSLTPEQRREYDAYTLSMMPRLGV
jgi:hypothetical protein